MIATSINTPGERSEKHSSLERADVSPRLQRFDVITEEDEESGIAKPMLTWNFFSY